METSVAIYNPDTRMRAIKTDDKIMWVTAILTRMHDMAGQKVDKANLTLMVRELLRDLDTRYKLLAVEEVETIIGNGVRGDYGEYYGLSIASISKWFKTYMDSGAHSDYLNNKVTELKLMLPEKTQLTEREVEEIMISGCIRCFNEYREKGKFMDVGNKVFDFMYLRKIINPTDEQIREYISMARDEYKRILEQKKNSLDPQTVKDARKEMIAFMKMGDDGHEIQALAKVYAMNEFFENLIESNITIEDIINQ